MVRIRTTSAMLLARIVAFSLFLGTFPGQKIAWPLRASLIVVLLFVTAPYLAEVSTASTSTSFLLTILSLDQPEPFSRLSLFSLLQDSVSPLLQELAWGMWLGICVSFVFYIVAILAAWFRASLGVTSQFASLAKMLSFAIQLLLLHLFLQWDGVGLTAEYFTKTLSMTVDASSSRGALNSLIFLTGSALRFATYLALPMFFLSLLIEFFLVLPVRFFPQGMPASLLASSRIPAFCLLGSLLLYPFVDVLSQAFRESVDLATLGHLVQRLRGG